MSFTGDSYPRQRQLRQCVFVANLQRLVFGLTARGEGARDVVGKYLAPHPTILRVDVSWRECSMQLRKIFGQDFNVTVRTIASGEMITANRHWTPGILE